ncbi:MAG TPA: prephenate dehydratase [Acidimicrobiales bacterium]|nr:prephenate dehydratase [Acidimicrobiales bacterium]
MSAPATLRRIAYLGPQGTFTEEALLSEPDLAECELVPMPTIAEAIGAADQGVVEYAFVPIENSIEGSVSATLDQLVFDTDLLIQREVVLEVHLDLLAVAGASLGGIRRVISFPHATAQIRRYLAATLPGASVGSTNSTADAARLVAEGADPEVAAVAPPLAAKLYGLDVLAHAIEDHAENRTRFVLLTKARIPEPTGHDRTAIACFQRANRPGSLLEILAHFAARNVDLTRLESRPTKQALGEYCFIIESEGHVSDVLLGDCLAELHEILESVRFLGSYPVSGAVSETRVGEVGEARRGAAEWLGNLRGLVGGSG